jgi:hypothetical protein
MDRPPECWADIELKVVLDAGALCGLVACAIGSLDVTAGEGWLLLQPDDLVGAKARKNGNQAGVTRRRWGRVRRPSQKHRALDPRLRWIRRISSPPVEEA